MSSSSLYPLVSKTYYFSGILTNLTPLRIGSGKSVAGEVDMPIIYSNGKPFIPGTSLKGALRTEAERFVMADGKEEYKVFFPDTLIQMMDDKDYLDNLKKCPTCLLFGAPKLLSRLVVYDAYVVSDYKVTIRTLTSINRITGAQKFRSLYTIEYVEPGAKFNFQMAVRGVKFSEDDKDIEAYMGKIVNHLLEVLKSGEFQIGSKKSAGFGKVILQDLKKKEG